MVGECNNLRILIVSQLPPPVHGSTVMTERFMKALVSAGFNCQIVERQFSKTMAEVQTITLKKVLRIPGLALRLVIAAFRFRPRIAVFFITFGLGSFLVDCFLLWILRLCKVNYVIYLHGRGLDNWGKHAFVPLRLLARKTLMSSFGGIVLGEVLKNDITEYIHPARVQVLPNGIPDDAKAFCRGNRIVAHGQPVTVLFLSNLVPTKGVLDFLKMAKAVIAQEENVRFVMAGRPVSPEFAEVLRSYIVSNNLQEHIRTVGPVYGEEKNHLFKQADIFVFPSHKETFPLVNLEAMQWAVPVVSTDVGAIREAVIDGENGYLVAVGDLSALVDRVLCLIRRPELRQMMGQRGRERFVVEYSQTAFERKVGAVVGCLIEMDG